MHLKRERWTCCAFYSPVKILLAPTSVSHRVPTSLLVNWLYQVVIQQAEQDLEHVYGLCMWGISLAHVNMGLVCSAYMNFPVQKNLCVSTLWPAVGFD